MHCAMEDDGRLSTTTTGTIEMNTSNFAALAGFAQSNNFSIVREGSSKVREPRDMVCVSVI
jgi:hypothetical protein